MAQDEYKMSDGLVIKKKNMKFSKYVHGQAVHCTRNGRWCLEYLYHNEMEYIDKKRAVIWLSTRGIAVPADLASLARQMKGRGAYSELG
jgi:hypothetical protein